MIFLKDSRKNTESWFDCLGVGNGGIPFWGVLFDVVIKNSTVDHPVVCEDYQIII